jgi:hypothetical protein
MVGGSMSLDVGCHIYDSYVDEGIWRILERRSRMRTFYLPTYLNSIERGGTYVTHEAVNIPVEPPNDSLAIAYKEG